MLWVRIQHFWAMWLAPSKANLKKMVVEASAIFRHTTAGENVPQIPWLQQTSLTQPHSTLQPHPSQRIGPDAGAFNMSRLWRDVHGCSSSERTRPAVRVLLDMLEVNNKCWHGAKMLDPSNGNPELNLDYHLEGLPPKNNHKLHNLVTHLPMNWGFTDPGSNKSHILRFKIAPRRFHSFLGGVSNNCQGWLAAALVLRIAGQSPAACHFSANCHTIWWNLAVSNAEYDYPTLGACDQYPRQVFSRWVLWNWDEYRLSPLPNIS